VVLFFGAGCQAQQAHFDTATEPSSPATTSAPPLDTSAIVAQAAQAVEAQLATTQPVTTTTTAPVSHQITVPQEELLRFIPDPIDVKLKDITRSREVRLSLQECLNRTAASNFGIRTESYGPAISAMDILKAEAAFDAVYFADAAHDKINQPTSSELASGNNEQTNLATGIRKLLPTGGTISGAYNLTRLDTELQFATLNPSYTNNFAAELRQPLLRGLGLDVNRASIDVAKNNMRIAKHEFHKKLRDVLTDVERTYWRLVQARRDVVIQKDLVDQTKETQEILNARRGYDVTSAMIARATSLSAIRLADYEQVLSQVKNLEDQLKALMNDPELNQGNDIEIIPTDSPSVGPIILDSTTEVQAAMENRVELKQSKLNIDNTRINIAVAKNQALPRFDLTFRYTVNGLGSNAGQAFDQMTTSNFQDYHIGISFEYPIGNRAARAGEKKAVLQRDQAIAALKSLIENIILEVHTSVRNLQTAYKQVQPRKESVEAARENVESLDLRTVALNPSFLDVKLSAQETLAQARRGLLSALVDYRIAVVDLERAKDTLLKYDNVVIEPTQAR
jgi:outer membrane protein TolC